MARKKLLFLYHSRAGKGKIRENLADVIDVLYRAGYEITVHPTQGSEDVVATASGLPEEYDGIVCSGGDGTLNGVVTGLRGCSRQVPVGYIPAGTTNDFAEGIGVPRDVLEAAEIAANGRLFYCDLGTFNEKTFIYSATFGIFTEVSYATRQEFKNTLGHLAYVLEGIKGLPSVHSYHMRAYAEGGLMAEGDFIFGMITNSISLGGFKGITGKSVKLDDGLFEVTLIKWPSNPVELNQIISALLRGEMDERHMFSFKTARLRLEADSDVAWSLDGEFGGNLREAEVRVLRQAQPLRVPDR